jgi:hypothetical protein
MTTSAPFRPLRTGLIGSIVLGLAAGGHLAGGGHLPEPGILAALCALTIVPVAAVTRFRLSMPVLTGLLGAGQLWLHWAFCALSSATPVIVPESMAHGHAGHTVLAPELFGAAVMTHSAGYDWQMFAAHTVATLGTALVLARGEQALSVLASWLRPLAQLPPSCVIVPARIPGPCVAPIALPRDQLVRRMPERRGPPALLPAA